MQTKKPQEIARELIISHEKGIKLVMSYIGFDEFTG